MAFKGFKQSLILLILLTFAVKALPAKDWPWQYFVRTSGHPLTEQNIEAIIADARSTYLFGIEVDNDITGRYDSFLNPEQKLKTLKRFVERVHAINNRAFVYIAGLECITSNADQKAHTLFKDHPDWVQRDIKGRPAVFGAKDAFWIHEGDEDVWISPYAPEWRKRYMELVQKIAATGVDGIYVDIPYWMTHFEGWEDTYASFDKYTVQAFKQKTGIDPLTQINLGDMTDPGFVKWLEFRLQTIDDFLAEIDRNAKAVNPACLTIAEVYPGIDFEAVRVGADVSRLYSVVDVITHEYSEGAYMASDRSPGDWYRYVMGMLTFKAFANGKPTYMLSYSWDGNKQVKPADAMRLLFLSQIFAGANSWDAAGHVMSGSNDLQMRKQIFKWIASYQEHFYLPRKGLNPIGVYFSPETRNLFSETFLPEFRGLLLLLMNGQVEFQVVVPQTLNKFAGSLLVLPAVRKLSAQEQAALVEQVQKGTRLIVTNAEGLDEGLKRFFDRFNSQQVKIYTSELGAQYKQQNRELALKQIENWRRWSNWQPAVQIDAPATVLTTVFQIDDRVHVFAVNFTGIEAGKNLRPRMVDRITVKINAQFIKSDTLMRLDYLQKPQPVTGQRQGDFYVWNIKNLTDGVFLWSL